MVFIGLTNGSPFHQWNEMNWNEYFLNTCLLMTLSGLWPSNMAGGKFLFLRGNSSTVLVRSVGLSQVGVLMKLPNLFFSKFTMAMKFVGGVPCSSGFHTDIHFSFGPMDGLYGHHCAMPTSVYVIRLHHAFQTHLAFCSMQISSDPFLYNFRRVLF